MSQISRTKVDQQYLIQAYEEFRDKLEVLHNYIESVDDRSGSFKYSSLYDELTEAQADLEETIYQI